MMIQINDCPLVCLYDNEAEAKQARKDISEDFKADIAAGYRTNMERVVLKQQKVRSVGVTSSAWVLTVVPAPKPAPDEDINDDYAAAAEAQHGSWGDQWLE